MECSTTLTKISKLFSQGSDKLKPKGKAFLRKFIPIYSGVIFSKPEFATEVSRVIVEGHTSSEGSEQVNLQLSLKRSASVAEYIFSQIKFSSKNSLEKKFLAAGRGEIEADKTRNNPADRKVVFRLQFRSDEFIEKYRTDSNLSEKRIYLKEKQ